MVNILSQILFNINTFKQKSIIAIVCSNEPYIICSDEFKSSLQSLFNNTDPILGIPNKYVKFGHTMILIGYDCDELEGKPLSSTMMMFPRIRSNWNSLMTHLKFDLVIFPSKDIANSIDYDGIENVLKYSNGNCIIPIDADEAIKKFKLSFGIEKTSDYRMETNSSFIHICQKSNHISMYSHMHSHFTNINQLFFNNGNKIILAACTYNDTHGKEELEIIYNHIVNCINFYISKNGKVKTMLYIINTYPRNVVFTTDQLKNLKNLEVYCENEKEFKHNIVGCWNYLLIPKFFSDDKNTYILEISKVSEYNKINENSYIDALAIIGDKLLSLAGVSNTISYLNKNGVVYLTSEQHAYMNMKCDFKTIFEQEGFNVMIKDIVNFT